MGVEVAGWLARARDRACLVGMKTVGHAEANADLDVLMNKVVADRIPIAITCEGSEGAVLVSESE